MKNSREMTLQDVFNVVWERAKNPVKAGYTDEVGHFTCQYRGVNKLNCFVGECIADGDYKETFEGKAADFIFIESLFPLIWAYTLRQLQVIHDYTEPNDWADELTEFARVNKLSIPN